jgi:hypothetical protein
MAGMPTGYTEQSGDVRCWRKADLRYGDVDVGF